MQKVRRFATFYGALLEMADGFVQSRLGMWRCRRLGGFPRGSFIPPAEIAVVRELTRYRRKLTEERTQETQRLQQVLEDGGIKLDSVASDSLGVSGRAMIGALISGERDPAVLADLARGLMRKKIPGLTRALAGRFAAHHALLAGLHLAHIDDLNLMIGRLEVSIDEAVSPFAVRGIC